MKVFVLILVLAVLGHESLAVYNEATYPVQENFGEYYRRSAQPLPQQREASKEKSYLVGEQTRQSLPNSAETQYTAQGQLALMSGLGESASIPVYGQSTTMAEYGQAMIGNWEQPQMASLFGKSQGWPQKTKIPHYSTYGQSTNMPGYGQTVQIPMLSQPGGNWHQQQHTSSHGSNHGWPHKIHIPNHHTYGQSTNMPGYVHTTGGWQQPQLNPYSHGKHHGWSSKPKLPQYSNQGNSMSQYGQSTSMPGYGQTMGSWGQPQQTSWYRRSQETPKEIPPTNRQQDQQRLNQPNNMPGWNQPNNMPNLNLPEQYLAQMRQSQDAIKKIDPPSLPTSWYPNMQPPKSGHGSGFPNSMFRNVPPALNINPALFAGKPSYKSYLLGPGQNQ